ncbi:LamG-like jellyroll fold domain-containing protein [Thermomonospora echinospora]|uniref:LamG-like jellyroll fold domain-containing protein n=1 Tax=Thermomonospora echinospora TaxID=1992 RepID=UPI001359C0EA|nr:LamG-like jellyroll fold domain-containing protein [Thermomonospora echinospora]
MTEEQAAEQAHSSGERVEVVSKRGEHQDVWALPDGGFELVQYLRPVRVRKNGAWVEPDTTLQRSGDAVVPAATSTGLRLSAGGSGPLVSLSRGGRTLSLTWPQELPEPVLEGDTAVYRGVLGADVDLQVRADVDGFAHTLVVKTAQAAQDPRLAQLAFGLNTSGLTVSEDPSGVLRATAPGAGDVFEAPAPMMWDSSVPAAGTEPSARSTPAAPASADAPGDASVVAPVQVEVGSGQMTLRPDQELLSSPDTRFPVFIDPVWGAKKAYAWAMVSSGYPNQSYYEFNGTEGLGFCDVTADTRCVKDQTKRLFYRFGLPSLAGKYVESTEFVAYETYAHNCDNGTVVRLYRTSALSASATWNNTLDNWGEHLASRDVAYCSRTPVEFGGATLREHVQSALNNKYSTITFGLRAYDETSMAWWKRFADDAYLKIKYNNPPKQPLNSSMYSRNPGGPCVTGSEAKWVNDLSTLYATLVDPDDEDANKVQGQFLVFWDNGDGTGTGGRWYSSLTAAKASGSRHSVKVPSTIPQRKLLGWNVRAWDGAQWGPWASDGDHQHACYFYYDPTVPPAPKITSSQYPEDEVWRDGVGRTGNFVIDDPSNTAVRYELRMNKGPTKTVTTTNGAAQTVALTPTKSGLNLLDVQSFTGADTPSSPETYAFFVKAGTEARARFTLNDPAGSASVQAAVRDGTGAVSAQPQGGTTLGVPGQDGTAIRLDGSTGHVVADAPIINTSQSFAVSAWVKLAVGKTAETFVSVDGVRKSGFMLQRRNDANGHRWAFAMTATDTDNPGWYEASAPNDPAARPQIGEWAHLVGVYDRSLNRLFLYVNGEPAGSAEHQAGGPWQATGPLAIGRARWTGGPADHVQGDIDDVRVFDRIVGPEEAKELFTQRPVRKARWKLNADGLDNFGPPLTLAAGAAIQPGAGFAWISPDGLQLNVTTGAYASTAGPVVDTDRSFTIAGWVRNTDLPQAPATVFSQAGTNAQGFALRYVPNADPAVTGVWQIEMNNADQTGSPILATHSTFTPGDWNHVALVYDAFRDTMSLYVDGALEESERNVSKRGLVRGFRAANGGIQIGRSKLGGTGGSQFWPDAIDDVWVYQGALSEEQIYSSLAARVELDTQSGP